MMILTEEMKSAIALLEDEKERFIWISGRAGTGKSTFLQHLKTTIRPRNAVYLAPTGVAALAIGGQTIHSFFWIDPGEEVHLETRLDPEKEARLYPKLAKVEVLVIDEISMVRADLMDEMDRRMRNAKGQPRRSFGGARLVLFGDPYQLPPVEPDPYGRSGELFERLYKSPFFFSSQVLRARARKIRRVEFTRVFRQNEEDFLATLDRCRSGRSPRRISTSWPRASSPRGRSRPRTSWSSRRGRTRPRGSTATAWRPCPAPREATPPSRAGISRRRPTTRTCPRRGPSRSRSGLASS